MDGHKKRLRNYPIRRFSGVLLLDVEFPLFILRTDRISYRCFDCLFTSGIRMLINAVSCAPFFMITLSGFAELLDLAVSGVFLLDMGFSLFILSPQKILIAVFLLRGLDGLLMPYPYRSTKFVRDSGSCAPALN